MNRISGILIIMAISFSLVSCKSQKAAETIEGKITFIQGEVTVNGKKANQEQVIQFNDRIVTADKSQCRIVADEKNIIAVKENSELIYRLKKGDGSLDLKKGFMGAILRNKTNISEFKVNTPTTAAAVRGTILFLGIENENSTYTCVCNGRVHFTRNKDKDLTVEASHHKATLFIKKGESIVTQKGTLKYHDDAMMEELAASIGESINWDTIED